MIITKFMAWAKTVPQTLGNPLYHWTHLELRRLGITGTLFGPETADQIWHECNELLATPEFSARGITQQMNVVMAGTRMTLLILLNTIKRSPKKTHSM